LRELLVLGLVLPASEADRVEVRAPRARELAGLLVTVGEIQERADARDGFVRRLEALARGVEALLFHLLLTLLEQGLRGTHRLEIFLRERGRRRRDDARA